MSIEICKNSHQIKFLNEEWKNNIEKNVKTALSYYKTQLLPNQCIDKTVIIHLKQNQIENNFLRIEIEKENILNKIDDDSTVIIFILINLSDNLLKILGGTTFGRFCSNCSIIDSNIYTSKKTLTIHKIILEDNLIGYIGARSKTKSHQLKFYHITGKTFEQVIRDINEFHNIYQKIIENDLNFISSSKIISAHQTFDDDENLENCDLCDLFSTTLFYLSSFYLHDKKKYNIVKRYLDKLLDIFISKLDSSSNENIFYKDLSKYLDDLKIDHKFDKKDKSLQINYIFLLDLLNSLKETNNISCLNGILNINLSKNYIDIKKILIKKLIFKEKLIELDNDKLTGLENLLIEIGVIRMYNKNSNNNNYNFTKIVTRVPEHLPSLNEAIGMGVLPPCVEIWVNQIKANGPKFPMRKASPVFLDMGFSKDEVISFYSDYSNPSELKEVNSFLSNKSNSDPEIEHYKVSNNNNSSEKITSLGRRCKTMIETQITGKMGQTYGCPFVQPEFSRKMIPDIEELHKELLDNPLSKCSFYFSKKFNEKVLISNHTSPTRFYLHALSLKMNVKTDDMVVEK